MMLCKSLSNSVCVHVRIVYPFLGEHGLKRLQRSLSIFLCMVDAHLRKVEDQAMHDLYSQISRSRHRVLKSRDLYIYGFEAIAIWAHCYTSRRELQDNHLWQWEPINKINHQTCDIKVCNWFQRTFGEWSNFYRWSSFTKSVLWRSHMGFAVGKGGDMK